MKRISQTNKSRGRRGRTANPVAVRASGQIAAASVVTGILTSEVQTQNSPPFWGVIPPTQAVPGVSLDIAKYAVDPDGDALTFSGGISGVSVSSSGQLLVTDEGLIGSTVSIPLSVTDGKSDPVTASIQISVIAQPTLYFAEIPEIVFIRGFPNQQENLGPWILDPSNRWTPGDIWNSAGWVPSRPISVVGTLPDGVSFGQETGILSYDGSNPTAPSSSSFVSLTDGTSTSRQFRVRVLRPTAIWGTGATTDPDILTWFSGVPASDPADGGESGFNGWQQAHISATRPDTDPNVALILGGTYEATSDGLTTYGRIRYKDGIQYIYTIGDPRSRPVFRGNSISSSFGPQSVRLAYWKDIELWDFSIMEKSFLNAEEDIAPKTTYYCNLYCHDQTRSGADVFGSDNRESSNDWVWDQNTVKTFIWRLEARNAGGIESTHLMYIHGRPNSLLHINASRMNGGRQSSLSKSTRWANHMYNSYMSIFRDDSDIEFGTRSAELIDWAGCGEHLLYNNHFRGGNSSTLGGVNNGFVRKRQRRDFWGSDTPAYPDMDYNLGTSSLVDGGYSSPPGFGPGGDVYKDPAFWAAVNEKPIGDPTNPYTFKMWMAYNTFEWVQEGNNPRQAWFGDMGTPPVQAAAQFLTTNIYGTIPPGWVERSANFFCNNTLIGWQQSDETDNTDSGTTWLQLSFTQPRLTNPDFPTAVSGAFYDPSLGYWVHGPGPYCWPTPPREVHYNEGLVTPWGGEFVPLPPWFKIAG